MKTLSEVRAKFDLELAQRAALPIEIDCGIVAEDNTAIFYLSLDDGVILTCGLDLSVGDCDAHDLIAALLSLGGTSAQVH